MLDVSKMIDLIQKLKAKTTENGATEAEMLSALEKASELMEKAGITEEDLENASVEKDYKRGFYQFKQKQSHPVFKFCSAYISEFCGVKGWGSTGSGNSGIHAFGLKPDIEMWEYLVQLIHDAMNRGWKEYLASNPKQEGRSRHTEYWSYMSGFASRVNDKLYGLIQDRKAKSSSGKDLVVAKQAKCAELVKSYLGIELNNSRSGNMKVDINSAIAGSEAGKKVNLNRPLSGKGSQVRIAA